MSSIPQLDMPPRVYRCSQRLPASCRYRLDHVYIPASNQQDVQEFLTNCAEEFENSKQESTHHPTLHLINRRRVLKPRYNNGRYATQTQKNDLSARNFQKQYQQSMKTPLPSVNNENYDNYENENNENNEIDQVDIFRSEYNQDNLISVPTTIRIRMYHRNEMMQPHNNDDQTGEIKINNDTIDDELPLPPYEEDEENLGEEIDDKEIDKAAEYTETNAMNEIESTNNEGEIQLPENENQIQTLEEAAPSNVNNEEEIQRDEAADNEDNRNLQNNEEEEHEINATQNNDENEIANNESTE